MYEKNVFQFLLFIVCIGNKCADNVGRMPTEDAGKLSVNGAAALQRADRIGSIEVGKQGDFIILNSDNYHILPYYIGMNCVIMTIKGGILYPVT